MIAYVLMMWSDTFYTVSYSMIQTADINTTEGEHCFIVLTNILKHFLFHWIKYLHWKEEEKEKKLTRKRQKLQNKMS